MKSRTPLSYFFCCCILCLWGCTQESLKSPVDYVKWVENPENGLLVVREVGKFSYRLQYKPAEYLAIRELKKPELEQSELQAKVASMNDMQYYTLQLGLKDGSDILKSNIESSGDYSRNIEYLSFGIQRDLKLVEGQDTLPCLLNHFERTYSISPYATLILAFRQKADVTTDKILIYDDHQFGSDLVELKIDQRDLDRIPQIKTQ